MKHDENICSIILSETENDSDMEGLMHHSEFVNKQLFFNKKYPII